MKVLQAVRRGSLRAAGVYLSTAGVLLNGAIPAIAGFPFRKTTAVEQLARQIDCVERHIEEYGTVVAKTPDVWGEARLTKYRVDYETEMKKQLGAFSDTINAAISRSDQAFLANSFALQAAISGTAAVLTTPSTSVSTVSKQTTTIVDGKEVVTQDPQVTEFRDGFSTSKLDAPSEPTAPELTRTQFDSFSKTTPGFGDKKVALEPTVMLDQRSRYLNHLNELRRVNDGDDQSDYPGYSLNLVRIPFSVLPGKRTREGYGAEVTVMAKPHLHDELLPKTFRHLVVNDVVDQLAFPLTKIISQKNAKELIKQMKGGNCVAPTDAEQQQLKDRIKELKADQQRLLSEIDDLKRDIQLAKSEIQRVDREIEQEQIRLQQANAKEGSANKSLYTSERKMTQLEARKEELILRANEVSETFAVQISDVVSRAASDSPVASVELFKGLIKLPADVFADTVISPRTQQPEPAAMTPTQAAISRQATDLAQRFAALRREQSDSKAVLDAAAVEKAAANVRSEAAESEKTLLEMNLQDKANLLKEKQSQLNPSNKDALIDRLEEAQRELDEALVQGKVAEALLNIVTVGMSIAPSRRSQLPFPPSQLKDVIGCRELGQIGDFISGIKSEPTNAGQVLLLDVQKALTAETEAAYAMLGLHPELWMHCTDEIVAAVRTSNNAVLSNSRQCFLDALPPCTTLRDHSRGALAWAILVESALLNQRLIEDIQHLTAAKNAPLANPDGMVFYGSNPDPMARATFNHYVQCRWPIHVVALDPVTQDQNIADRFSMQREMQLALSLAFTTGNMSAQNFTRYARKISLDMETIDLNRTAIAFSHGDDTFGWRFMPRVQSPDIEGNCRVLMRDVIHGGRMRDYDLSQRRLEAGPRECTAIVIMPSFVPYVIFDVRTNWFKLTNPKRKELTTEDAVRLSAEITCMQRLSNECMRDAHLYRADEVYRLCRSVEQLERRLPLQSTYVPMPFDNSLGGFEFFNSGVPDLAPELHGYYGEPGIVVDHSRPAAGAPPVEPSGTTLFLVGDNFNVHETHVLAGNRDITASMVLLSRQIMRVTVPPNVMTLDDGAQRKVVDIHVSTPYGVSNHLAVLAVPSPTVVATAASEAEKDKAIAKAINEAIETHVAVKHVDKFKWQADSPVARIVSGKDGLVQSLYLSSPFAITNSSESPFTADGAELRCFVLLQVKGDKTLKKLKTPTNSVGISLRQPNPVIISSATQLALQTEVETVLKEENVVARPEIEAIHLEGYLRFHSAPSTSGTTLDAAPIVRIEGRLPIAITIVGSTPMAPPPPVEEPILRRMSPVLPAPETSHSFTNPAGRSMSTTQDSAPVRWAGLPAPPGFHSLRGVEQNDP